MVRREHMHKRRTRRGGGILNRVRGFFTRKRGTVVPAAPLASTAVSRQPVLQPKSKWSLPSLRTFFTRKQKIAPEPIVRTSLNKSKYSTEDFPSAFQRVVWYVKQRIDGKSHAELVPYLDRPGSFSVSQAEFEEFKLFMLEIIRLKKNNLFEASEFLKRERLGETIDKEINSWEKAERLTPLNRQTKCIDDRTCLLYPGTPQEKLPFDNVANGLTRFLGVLLEHENIPGVIQYKTNYARVCTDNADRFLINSQSTLMPVDQIQETELMFGKDRAGEFFTDYVVLDDKFRRRAPAQVPTYYPQGCYDEILSMYTITEAVVNKEIYLMHPRFTYIFMNKYPDLYEESFGTTSGWTDMSPLERMRMALICWYAGRYLLSKTPDGPRAREVYLTYPEPALSILQSIPEDSEYNITVDFPIWFEKYQELVQSDSPSEKVIPFDTYLSMLQERQDSLAAQREKLFARPEPSLPAINLSAAVPYNAATALSTTKRTNYFRSKFRDPQMTARQKAQARNLLSIAQVQEQQGNVYMTEKELANINSSFIPSPRPNWTYRRGRRMRKTA